MDISSSLFGAMQAAIFGLNAQSGAISYVSENIANSQTTGYKRIEAQFSSFTIQSDAIAGTNTPGGATVKAFFDNTLQGGVAQNNNSTNFAVSGGGFIEVAKQSSINTATGAVTFENGSYYTRKADFNIDLNGYLRNSAGAVLRAWTRNNSTGNVTQISTEVVIPNTPLQPNKTTKASFSLNLPASSTTQAFTSGSPSFRNTFEVYDSLGNQHPVDLNWTHVGAGNWAIEVNVADATQTFGNSSATMAFNTSGTIATGTSNMFSAGGTQNGLSFSTASVNGTTHNYLTFSVTGFPGAGSQSIDLDLGPTTGNSNTVTQYSGTTLNINSQTQDGYGVGLFKSVSITPGGIVQLNYDNGQVLGSYQIPIYNFADPTKLNRVQGDMFETTISSGAPLAGNPGQGGRGSVISSALESSNVDIADEFTKMIVAQRIYTANSKMVNVVDEMLQEAVNLKR